MLDPITPTSAWSAGRPTSTRTALRGRAPTRSSWAAEPSATGSTSNIKDYVPYDRVVAELVPVFTRFKDERKDGESFGDFCDRVGVEELARATETLTAAATELNPVG